MSKETNVLILGFYNRQNIGDDAYTLAFPHIFRNRNCKLSFMCMDDVETIPSETDIVIIGGGDVINDYFMCRAQKALNTFCGRVYAVSVGIPFSSFVKYLHIFDNVFVRSQEDYRIACIEVGEENVTYCPDIVSCLPLPATQALDTNNSPIRIGLCLAQPLFYNNPKRSSLITSLCSVLGKVYNESVAMYGRKVELHLLAFNFNTNNNSECDHIINNTVAKVLSDNGMSVFVHHDLVTPNSIMAYIKTSIDVNLCMRYHSVIFSLMTDTPFVPLYVSQKVGNLLNDIGINNVLDCNLEVDAKYRPKNIDEDKLSEALNTILNQINNKNVNFDRYTNLSWGKESVAFDNIVKTIMDDKKYSCMLVRSNLSSFEDVLLSCQKALCKYLHLDAEGYSNALFKTQPLCSDEKSSLEIARFICFIITGQTHNPCVWGLASNLSNNDFCLYNAIKYIWDECKVSQDEIEKTHTYYPTVSGFERRALANLDFVLPNDFSQYHRSGWAYVVGGLMNIDASHTMKTTEIFIDTYVDRSFHWGEDVLQTLGVIPYRKPWYGFIHHVFDQTHSEYNCVELMRNPNFIESLKCCKGLIALSQSLANQLQGALSTIGYGDVSVHVMYHPMEFVENVFTMEKFLANTNKCVAQIGAWLRKPYTIYELPLQNGGPLALTKVALKGKEMDQYFAPPEFMDVMGDTLLKTDWFHQHTDKPQCPDSKCKQLSCICRQVSCICRPSKRSSTNKYCEGLYETIVKNHNSVVILDKLNNDEYDRLLSENIVFLNLVDCSAVNTVLECIVRNTILIVNRLPALVEVLGLSYPGFYDTLSEAAEICGNVPRLYMIHRHLSQLDKSRYALSHFMVNIQRILLEEDVNNTYALFNETTSLTSINHFDRLSRFSKYLPLRYLNKS